MRGWFHGIKIGEWNIFSVVLSHDGFTKTLYAPAGLQAGRQVHRTARYFFRYRNRPEEPGAPHPRLLAGGWRKAAYRRVAGSDTGRFLPDRCRTPVRSAGSVGTAVILYQPGRLQARRVR